MWGVLMKKRCKFLDDWLRFVEHHCEQEKNDIIKKDQWEQLYQLVKDTKGDMSKFVDDGAYASIIDDFVEFKSGDQEMK